MEAQKIANRTWYLFSICCVLISAVWALDFVYVNSEGMLISEIWAMFVVLTLLMGLSMIVLHWRRLPSILYLRTAIKTLKQNNAITPKEEQKAIINTIFWGWIFLLSGAAVFFMIILPGDLLLRGAVGVLIGLMVLIPNSPDSYHSYLRQVAKPHLKEEEKAYGKPFFAKWSDYLIFAIGVLAALGIFFLEKGL
jgi:hypothetical protein